MPVVLSLTENLLNHTDSSLPNQIPAKSQHKVLRKLKSEF